MSYLAVPNTPLQLLLKFVEVDQSPPPQPHPVAGGAGILTRALLLQQLPPDTTEAFTTLFTQPLQILFDQNWTQSQTDSDINQRPVTVITNSIKDAESRAYAVNVSVPSRGSLRALSGNVSSGLAEKFPAQLPGHQLTLSYLIQGFNSTFNVTTDSILGSWADPRVNFSFDGEYLVELVIPENPAIPIAINAEFLTQNLQVSGDTIFSGIEIALNSIVNTLKAVFSGNSATGGGALPGTQSASKVPALLVQLSNALVVASNFGFTQMDVKVDPNPLPGTDPGNTVEIILTHPQEPGPVLRSDNDPTSPILEVDPTQVHPGDTININLSFFPPQRATIASLFGIFLPGGKGQVEVEWGPTTAANVVPVQTDQNKFDVVSETVIISSLQPSTEYGFRGRTYDIPDFLASDWGAWHYLRTASSDQSFISLNSSSGSQIVSTTASISADRSASAHLKVPLNTPPGIYHLTVSVPDNNPVIATIQVIALSAALAPTIFLKDSNGLPTSSALVDQHPSQFYGTNWPPISDVDIYLDAPISGTHLGTIRGNPPEGSWTTQLTFPDALNRVEWHNVVALQASLGLQASCKVLYQGPPK